MLLLRLESEKRDLMFRNSLSYQEINQAFNIIAWLKAFYLNLFGVECFFKNYRMNFNLIGCSYFVG